MRINPRFFPAREQATALVVVIHGLNRRVLDTVPDVVREQMPHADVLTPLYRADVFSNEDPVLLAEDISSAIETQFLAHRDAVGADYGTVILIGHSRGSLLARKAFVFACGQNQELNAGGLQPVPKTWHHKVTRIVLLAGINRGWSLSPKPARMSWTYCLFARVMSRFAWLFGTAKLLRGVERGAPFVANLRVQWIRLCRMGAMPVTVQILGDRDDLVSPEDNIDLQAGRDFVYLQAPAGTNHHNVVELNDAARRRVFVRALTGSGLQSEYVVPNSQREDEEVERVVFVMHGIRDFGGWTARLAAAVHANAKRSGTTIATVRSSYGFFPMAKFLLFSERQKNVRWFMDQYTEALARYPKAEPIDFVGHSNGTYLLGSALRRYHACSFGNIVCAGSVLPREYEWNEMAANHRIGGIRNYLASADWVVGIFPNIFDRFGDIGGGGFLGFTKEPAVSNQFQYVEGGHGAALVSDNFDSIAAFLLNGKAEDPPDTIRRPEASAWVELASKLDWLVWLVLVAGVGYLAYQVSFVWTTDLAVYPWLRLVIFVGLLIALLNSV